MGLIPFNRPFISGNELKYIQEVFANLHLSGDGPFTRKCHSWLKMNIGCEKALLSTSCTAALEMAAILADIKPGDEVIMPSFTFTSTANAFVLRGGVPVFVDIRPDTLNMDETKIESAITRHTRAIAVVHYSGVACEMDAIMEIAGRFGLLVIEDAAQGIMSKYWGKPLGSIGHFGTFSFHETKNSQSGEGGALVVNRPDWIERAEIVWEKGTNRSQFFRGQVDKYTWMDIGSSYLPNEITAAFLYAQLESIDAITAGRLSVWKLYHDLFEPLENAGKLRRPVIPEECTHNGHIYYLLLPDQQTRDLLLRDLNASGINAVFHYIPLHSSPAGRKYGRASGALAETDMTSGRLLRLPLWVGMTPDMVHRVAQKVYEILG